MRQAHCSNVSVHRTALYHQLPKCWRSIQGGQLFILTSKDIKQLPNHYHHHYFRTVTSTPKQAGQYGFMKRKGNRTPCYTFISSFCSRLNDLMTALLTHKKDILYKQTLRTILTLKHELRGLQFCI